MEGKSQPISIQAREEEALGECHGSLHSYRYVPSHPLIPSSTHVRLMTRLQPLPPALLSLFQSVNIAHTCLPSPHQFIPSSVLLPGYPLPIPSVAYHVTSVCPLPPSSCPHTDPSSCLLVHPVSTTYHPEIYPCPYPTPVIY